MSSDRPTRLVAYAVTHDDPPEVFLADDEHVLSRLLCSRLVAATPAESLDSADLANIREALLDERWGDAVGHWTVATGIVVDAYPSERVWTDEELTEEDTHLELRVAPIFEDPPSDAQ